jgi:hypothetical protein
VNATDMTAPVTRGELREELAVLRQEVHQRISSLEEKHGGILENHGRVLEHHSRLLENHGRLLEKNGRDLELWGGALLERMKESEQRLAKQLGAEIARHIGAIQEDMQKQFAAFHEAFGDLPERMRRVEAAVFPARGAGAARRGRKPR